MREDDANRLYDFFDEIMDDSEFADPSGVSSLRAATPDNPRIYPCPECGEDNKLTLVDVQLGYQCDECARMSEYGW